MLDDIWNAISSIPTAIEEFFKFIGDFCNGFWIGFTNVLNDFGNAIGQFFEGLGKIFSDFGKWCEQCWISFCSWCDDVWIELCKFAQFLGDFFVMLGQFLIDIVVPTSSQWADIQNDYVQMGNAINSHIPFVGLFSEELKKAQETVAKTDFLVITVPSFSFSSGGVGVSTSEQKVINVGQAYEPYRAYIRGFLLLIVVGLAFVFIVKYVLGLGRSETISKVRDDSK